MPLGDPPKKPDDGASEAEFERYRADFDLYVAAELKTLRDREEGLQKEKEESDAKYEALVGREKELDDLQKNLASRELRVNTRETIVETSEENLKADEKRYTDKVAILTKQQAEVKLEEKRLKELAKDLDRRGPVGGGGIPPGLEDILLQQKTLVEKQVQIESEREKREKEEKERREKTGLISKGLKPPIFRGVEGERPEAHLMRAKDWLEAANPLMTEALKIQNFRLTLDHNAREWYDKADCKDTWENLRTQFSQYFSTQGKSIFNLQKRWNSFTFNEETDDIEVFLRDVQETAKQLKYTDDLVCTMIKTHIPRSLAFSLYKVTNLDELVSAVRNQLARSKPVSSAGGATGTTATTPFSAMKPAEASFFNIDDNNGQKQKPFKPQMTPQGRGRRRGRGGRGGRGRGQNFQQRNDNRQNNQEKGQSFRGGWQPRGRGGRGGRGRFDKSPNIRKPRVASKTPTQNRCFNCNEPGHFYRECPLLTRNGNGQPQQKSFPGYNMAQPQVYSQMAIPQIAQVPMQMGVPTAPVQNNSSDTAMMGHMRDVMLQMQDVTVGDNPCYMEMSEIPREGEPALNF